MAAERAFKDIVTKLANSCLRRVSGSLLGAKARASGCWMPGASKAMIESACGRGRVGRWVAGYGLQARNAGEDLNQLPVDRPHRITALAAGHDHLVVPIPAEINMGD